MKTTLKKIALSSVLLSTCISIAVAQSTKKVAAKQTTNTKVIATKEEKLTVAGKYELVETISKSKVLGNIPYKRFLMPNGLNIIVIEDHSDPICHVDVTYHVGSNREQIGRSGFAHFFEHMMFQGSENVADEEHFKIVTEAGGTLNGTTNKDRTNYFETLPNNQLEIGLWLEADRMGFLLNAVTQSKFEVQRATVKNERGQNYDNRPYGLMNEKINRSLFPYGHPYSWSTIGDLVDLDRVDVNDLKQFFMRWYGPNNATLTVAGDVDTKNVLELAHKYFGSIPRGPEVKDLPKMPTSVSANRYISYEDKVRFPAIEMAWSGVQAYHPDAYALDALAYILGQSETSMLYQKFIKTQKAVSAFSYNPTYEIAGNFNISVRAMPETTLGTVEKEINTILSEFDKVGVTDQELAQFKAKTETDYIQQLSSVSGKASIVAEFFTFAKRGNQLETELAMYNRLTKEDVMAAFRKYVLGKSSVILSCVPQGKNNLVAAPDNFNPKETNPADGDLSEYKGLTYNRPNDTFDRSKKPASGPNPFVKVPDFTQETAPNGLKIVASKNDEIPVINMQLYVECGHRMESKEKAGVANLLSDMLNESTAKYTAEEKAAKLAQLGAEISAATTQDNLVINISTPTKNLTPVMEMLEEVLLRPRFDNEDFERNKKQTLEGIKNQSTQAAVIANNVMNKLMYGDNSIMSIPVIGNVKTVESITLDDVKKYYEANFKPNISSFIVTGDYDKVILNTSTQFLRTAWRGQARDKSEVLQPMKKAANVLYLVDKENAPQSEIRIGYLSQAYDATGDYYKSRIMNYSLGGAFNSRINLNLREKRGFTYGARAGFQGGKQPGLFVASAGVKGPNTDSSIVEFMSELKRFADEGITDEELAFTKSALSQADALKYETGFQKAGFLKNIIDYNLSKTYVEDQNAILKNISKSEINGIAKKYIPYKDMMIVTVGDKKTNFDKLKALGYQIVEVDTDGNIKNPTPANNGSLKEGYKQ